MTCNRHHILGLLHVHHAQQKPLPNAIAQGRGSSTLCCCSANWRTTVAVQPCVFKCVGVQSDAATHQDANGCGRQSCRLPLLCNSSSVCIVLHNKGNLQKPLPEAIMLVKRQQHCVLSHCKWRTPMAVPDATMPNPVALLDLQQCSLLLELSKTQAKGSECCVIECIRSDDHCCSLTKRIWVWQRQLMK